MSHNRDLSAAAAQFGFHSSNIGIGSEAPRYPLDIHGGNLLVSGSAAGNLILEDRGVGDSSRPFHVVSSDGGNFKINRSNRNASGTTTSSVNSLTLSSSGNLGLGPQTNPTSNIHIADLSANGYELKISGNALQFNRTSSSYIDQVNDTGSILFRMGSSYTEAMRITSSGNIGVGVANPTQKLMVKGIIASEATNSTNNWMGYTYTDNTFRLNYNGAGADEVTITSSGLVGINDTTPDATLSVGGSTAFVDIGAAGGNRAKIGYSSNDCYFGTSSSSGQFIFKNNVTSSGNPADSGVERLRVDNAGTLLVNATIDNAGAHGRIVAHAPTSGNTIYKAIEIGNTDGDGTARGAAICGQPKSNSHLPYTLIGSWDHGDNTDCYYGGGWGGAMRPATRHRFYTNSSYPTSGGSGTENMTLNGSGHLTLPNHPSFGCIKNGNQYPVNGQRTIITSWTEHFDQGGHFNASTGVFTAPVQGKYYFYISAMMDRNDNGDYQISIYRNGAQYYNSNDMLSTGVTYMQTTICGIVEMSANDTVDFRMYNSTQTSSYIYTNHYTHCGGFLIG